MTEAARIEAMQAEIERLRDVVDDMLGLIQDYAGDGRSNYAGLATWFEEWGEKARAALEAKEDGLKHIEENERDT